MSVNGVLLGFQAAGALLSFSQAREQMKINELGLKVSNAAYETNLEMLRTKTTQDSLNEMIQLRKTLGTQIAIAGARGTSTSAGSFLSIMESSIGEFQQDERTRRLNLLAGEAQLRANNVMSGLHTYVSETQLGQSMTRDIINKIPVKGLTEFIANPLPERGFA
jgi:hypothetical protein